MRKFLDSIYKAGGVIGAACLVGILVIIVLQMIARWTLVTFAGSTEYAGYLMAASSFFSFAYALNHGAHVRVSILLKALGNKRYYGEIWGMLIGSLAASYLAWYAVKLVYWSVKFGDISQGRDATPLWIVQLPVAAGATILAICFWDNLISLLFRGRDNIKHDTIEQEI